MKIPTVRFNLKFFNANGEEAVVRTLDDLGDKFNLSDLDEYFKAGDLSRWLRGLNESNIADQVDSLKSVSDRKQVLERLCNVLGILLPNEAIADYCNMLERQEKMKGSRREQMGQKKESPSKPHVLKSCGFLSRDMRSRGKVRAYLAELMERHDEKEMLSFLHDVINKCIVNPLMFENDGPPIVLLALMGNRAWRAFVTASFDVRLSFHVLGGDRQMKVAVFPKDLSDSQLQGSKCFKLNDAFPPYFPICAFDYDVMTNNYGYDIMCHDRWTDIDKQIGSREIERGVL